MSSIGEHARGFWEYFWVYAETHVGVYRASTAMAAMFGLLIYFNPWFAVPAIAAYFLPPMYLYLSGKGLEDGSDARTDTDTDFDGADADADADGADADADADGADADADADS